MMSIKDVLNKLNPKVRARALEIVKQRVKERQAILRKHSNLFTNDPLPTTSAPVIPAEGLAESDDEGQVRQSS
jgi:hypothetical protein